jgi:hypothetical protein
MDRHIMIRMPSMPTGLPRTMEEGNFVGMDEGHETNHNQHHLAQSTPTAVPPPLTDKPKETLTLPLSSSRAGAGYHSPQPHSMYNIQESSTQNLHLTVPVDSHRRISQNNNTACSRSTTPGTMNADEAAHGGSGGGLCNSSSSAATSEADFVAEIRRLRERLAQLETENTSLNRKLNQQQWEVDHRLAEIEMHICGSDSPSGSDFSELTISNLPPLEKPNRESII